MPDPNPSPDPNPNPAPTPNPKPEETPGGGGKNTPGIEAGKGTPAPQPNPEDAKTFTQAEVDAMFQKRLSKAVKAELRKMSGGDDDGKPTVEELQQRSEAAERDLNFYKARDQVEDFVADKKNSVSVRNMKALVKFFKDDFEFDDKGKVTNLKEIFTRAKIETPELLGTVTGSIDAGAGNNNQPSGGDMNAMIRRAAGRQ